MKIKLSRSRKTRTISLTFSAEGIQEGADLKDVVIAGAKDGAINIDTMAKTLHAQGYVATSETHGRDRHEWIAQKEPASPCAKQSS